MKRTLTLLSTLFALLIIVQMNLKAQKNEPATINANTVLQKPVERVVNAGDTIRGIIRDSNGPIIAVNVVEIDKTNRIKAYSVSDSNGEFSFCAVDPKNDSIRVSLVGYKPFSSPINANYFDITLAVDSTIINKLFWIESVPRISLEEFEGLGITTIDEALNGRFGLDVPVVP